MRALTLARSAAVTVAALSFGVAVACTSSSTNDAPSFCAASKASWRSCTERSSCDDILAASCESTAAVLSPSTLTATQNCLEAGICGNASCLTRAPKASLPTEAHRALAKSYCASCAPELADCESSFYAKRGKLPGPLVLPYGASVALAVEQACTGSSSCQSSFATCAADTIVSTVGSTIDPSVADCIVAGFRVDDEGLPSGPGTGPETTTCTAANCKGCCRDDKCEEGTSAEACGGAAAACETCSGAQRCGFGGCKEPCGPANCAGCCKNDICQTGEDDLRCGETGAECKSCVVSGSSFLCSNQKCIDGSCRATCTTGCCSGLGCQPGSAANACGNGGSACVDCGYGRSCGRTKACELDTASAWSFVVLSAVVPNRNKSGSTWDITNGAADPFVVVYSSQGTSSHRGETSTKDNTHSPSWNEALIEGVGAAEMLSNLSFEIWDSDVGNDDLIGGCAIKLTAASFTGAAQTVRCPATASTVEVKLVYRVSPP